MGCVVGPELLTMQGGILSRKGKAKGLKLMAMYEGCNGTII